MFKLERLFILVRNYDFKRRDECYYFQMHQKFNNLGVMAQRFNAFISYSHAMDGNFAPALQKALQRIAKPILKRRALNIFRDETSLSATPHLWGTIEKALWESDFLILIGSPKAASSEWVQKEVFFWLQNKSVNTILICLTGGDIIWDTVSKDFNWTVTTALPLNLKGKFIEEPLYVDFRKARTSDDLSLNNPDFKQKAARIASAIHGLAMNDLIGEDVKLHKRAIRLRYRIILALSVLVLSTSIFAWLSYENSLQAEAQKDIAEKRLREVTMARDSLDHAIDSIQGLIVEVRREKDTSEQRRLLAVKNELLALQRERTAKRLRFNSDMTLALSEWESGRTDEAIALVTRHNDRSEFFIWRYLKELTNKDIAVMPVHRAMSVYLAADGEMVYSGGDDTGLQKWALDESLIQQMSPKEGLVVSIDGTKDGKLLAWVQEGNAFMQDLENGSKTKFPLGSVNSIRFSPDGAMIALATDQLTVVQHIESGSELIRRPSGGFLGGHSVAFVPGSDWIALGNEKGEILIWNLLSDSQETLLDTPDRRKIYSLAASADGKYLASATTSNGQLEVWDVGSWERRKFAEIYHNSPTDGMLSISADGKFLASPDGSMVNIWDLQSGTLMKSYKGHNAGISSLSWATNKGRVASGGYDGTVRVWNAMEDQRYAKQRLHIETHPEEMFIKMSRDKQYIALGFTNLDVYDHSTMRLITTLAHNHPVRIALFLEGSPVVATVTGPFEEEMDWDGPELSIWDLRTGTIISQTEIKGGGIGKLKFVDSGKRLLLEVRNRNDSISVVSWDIAKGKFVNTVNSSFRSHNNRTIFAAMSLANIKGHNTATYGSKAAVASKNNIEIWPNSTAQPILLTSHKALVSGMDFSPDGRTLASITYNFLGDTDPNGELKLWDAETGSELASFLLDGHLNQVGFTQDGTFVSVVCIDGSVYSFAAPKPVRGNK